MRSTLGRYAVLDLLGKGAFGSVYRVRHSTGAIRALKLLAGTTGERAERFRREIESLARMQGQGVVAIHEAGVTPEGEPYYVMDLLPGGSLRDRLHRTGALPWRDAASLTARLARSLHACHAHGLVHRDLKPDNVLFDEQGEPRLTDFGCVRDESAEALTKTGTLTGTPFYMAPEQLQGQKTDRRADIWALGCVLHELVSGNVPFQGTTLLQQAALAVTGERKRVGPRDLEAVLDRCLAPEPARRYATAEELAVDLELVLQGKKTASAIELPRRSRPIAAVIIGSAALVAVVVVALAGGARERPATTGEVAARWTEHARTRAHALDGLLAAQVADALSREAPPAVAVLALEARARAELAHGSDDAAIDAASRALDLAATAPVASQDALRLIRVRARLRKGEVKEATADLALVRTAALLEGLAQDLVAHSRWEDVLVLPEASTAVGAAQEWARHILKKTEARQARERLARLGPAARDYVAALEGELACARLMEINATLPSDVALSGGALFPPTVDAAGALERLGTARRLVDEARVREAVLHVLRVIALEPYTFGLRDPAGRAIEQARTLELLASLERACPTLDVRVWVTWCAAVLRRMGELPVSEREEQRLAAVVAAKLDEPELVARAQEALALRLEERICAGEPLGKELLQALDAAIEARSRAPVAPGETDHSAFWECVAADVCVRLSSEEPALLERARAYRESAGRRGVEGSNGFVRAELARVSVLLALARGEPAEAVRAGAAFAPGTLVLPLGGLVAIAEASRMAGDPEGASGSLERYRRLDTHIATYQPYPPDLWWDADYKLCRLLVKLAGTKGKKRDGYLEDLTKVAASKRGLPEYPWLKVAVAKTLSSR